MAVRDPEEVNHLKVEYIVGLTCIDFTNHVFSLTTYLTAIRVDLTEGHRIMGMFVI